MIDLHCHLIAGIDDGPSTLDDAVALARAMADQGIAVAAATPHVNARYPNDPAGIAAGLVRLQETLAEAGVGLRVVGGAEIEAARVDDTHPDDLRALAIDGRWLVVETPLSAHPDTLWALVMRLGVIGLGTILAHPERNPYVRDDPRLVAPAVEAGALVQINAESVLEGARTSVRGAAWWLIENGLGHMVASDAHSAGSSRSPRLAQARDAVAARLGDPAADALTTTVPRGVLDGEGAPALAALAHSATRRSRRSRRPARTWRPGRARTS